MSFLSKDLFGILKLVVSNSELFDYCMPSLCVFYPEWKIIAEKRTFYAKKHYLCTAYTSYRITQIINPLKTIKE